MTREEAIQMLIRMQEPEAYEPQINAYAYDALQMAIEALRNKNDLPISPLLKEPKQPKNGSELFGNTEKLDNGITGETCTDAISRAAVVDMLDEIEAEVADGYGFQYGKWRKWACELPSAQPDRDIPKKPTETTDRTWGIPHRQPVCPNCGCYLGMTWFICDGDGKRKVTFCETCGQAIDWEGWDEDESD